MLSPYPWQCLITLSTSINLRDTYLHVLSIYLTDVCLCADRKTQKMHETHIQLPLFRCGHTTRDRKHNLVDHLDEGQGCAHCTVIFEGTDTCVLTLLLAFIKKSVEELKERITTQVLKGRHDETETRKRGHNQFLLQASSRWHTSSTVRNRSLLSSTPVKQKFQ